MAQQEIIVKIDPRQMDQLRDALAELESVVNRLKVTPTPGRPAGLTGRLLAQSAAEDGWYETTTFQDLAAGRRTFLAGENAVRQINATGVELGKKTAELAALKVSMLQLADELEHVPGAPGADQIRKRVGR